MSEPEKAGADQNPTSLIRVTAEELALPHPDDRENLTYVSLPLTRLWLSPVRRGAMTTLFLWALVGTGAAFFIWAATDVYRRGRR
jgi:hypothetical protein